MKWATLYTRCWEERSTSTSQARGAAPTLLKYQAFSWNTLPVIRGLVNILLFTYLFYTKLLCINYINRRSFRCSPSTTKLGKKCPITCYRGYTRRKIYFPLPKCKVRYFTVCWIKSTTAVISKVRQLKFWKKFKISTTPYPTFRTR